MIPGDSMKLEFPNVYDPESDPFEINYLVDGVVLEACDLCFTKQLSKLVLEIAIPSDYFD